MFKYSECKNPCANRRISKKTTTFVFNKHSVTSMQKFPIFKTMSVPYIENNGIDFMEYFSDVVGVTVPANCDIENIILKVDRKRYNYIESKPFHELQAEIKHLSDEKDVVIRLQLIPNYEFVTLLLGFADSIEIIELQSLREKITERARCIIEKNKYCADIMHNKI